MIGIGMPMSQSRMERITSASKLPARAQQWFGDGTVPSGSHVSGRVFGMMLSATAH